MFSNHVKLAWRNLLRHRRFSLINLFGLSVSMGFCLLLFFHIRFEQSFDGFAVKKDRLFRLEKTNLNADARRGPAKSIFSFLTRGADEENDDIFPLAAGPDMQPAFPEIESYTRWDENEEDIVRVGGDVYREDRIVYADANFFRNFSLTVLKGDAERALADPQNVVLTASTARKYFGDKDPIGRTVQLASDTNRLFRVAAIAADSVGAKVLVNETLWNKLGKDAKLGFPCDLSGRRSSGS